MFATPLRGIHVFWMVFLFFAVIIAVDAFFIMRAVNTFPGEQVKNSYVLGLDYNREVERHEAQARLGWTAQAGIDMEDGRSLILRIYDRDSAPLSGLSVSATYRIRGEGNDDRVVSLQETAPGRYQGGIDAPVGSRIEVEFSARRSAAEAPVFEATKNLVIS